MLIKTISAGLLCAGLAACSPTAQAPASSDLAQQDLDSFTAAYQLVQFDLAECGLLQGGGASAQTMAVSQTICADATSYQGKLQQLAAEHNVALPDKLNYDNRVRLISLKYHPSPNINVQYLQDAIDSHEDALRIFRDETVNGTSPEIMRFDQGAIPVAQTNLDSLRASLAAAS